jgi:hypothetical protein
VPKNASDIMVAAAVIAAGLAMLKVLTKWGVNFYEDLYIGWPF